MGDHEAVMVDINAKRQRIKENKRKVFIYSKADTDSLGADIVKFKDDFLSSDYLSRSIDENWSMFKSMVTNAMNKHIPTKNVRGRLVVVKTSHGKPGKSQGLENVKRGGLLKQRRPGAERFGINSMNWKKSHTKNHFRLTGIT